MGRIPPSSRLFSSRLKQNFRGRPEMTVPTTAPGALLTAMPHFGANARCVSIFFALSFTLSRIVFKKSLTRLHVSDACLCLAEKRVTVRRKRRSPPHYPSEEESPSLP